MRMIGHRPLLGAVGQRSRRNGGQASTAAPAALRPHSPYALPRIEPRLQSLATLVMVVGCILVGVSMPETFAEAEVYRHCAIWLLPVLPASFLIQAGGNLRSLVRADVVALCALYFLTFAEFLSPEVRVLYALPTGKAEEASWLVLLTLVTVTIGRHLPTPKPRRPTGLPQISLQALFWIGLACYFLGYLWPLITVNFNPVALITEAFGPRFTQPWQRERLGGWTSFLTELDLLHFAFAALAGILFSARPGLPLISRAILTFLILFMLVFDFADGSRYVLVVKVGLLISGFVIGGRQPSLKFWIVAAAGLAFIVFASGEMVQIRNQGAEIYFSDEDSAESANGFMIDNNMISIARTVAVIPQNYPYLGSDVLVSALTKWVPRALWPSKPEAIDVSLMAPLGLDGSYTLAVTMTGEAYLIAGWFSLMLVGLAVGAFCGAWNRLGEMIRTNLDLTLYVSIFFPFSICMRSLQFVTVALLPTIAIYLFGKLLTRPRRKASPRRFGAARPY